LLVVNTPTLNQHTQENHTSTSLIHQTSTASIPMVPFCQGAPAGPVRQQNRRQPLQRVYDKPGNKPAVSYEPDLLRLQVLSRQRGGKPFAIAWLPKAFTKGVTANELGRTLSEDEINAVDHDHGFRLSQAYDGFLEKVEDRFECGLCAEEKRANWKNRKDAIRHFQKFPFGIGETCGTW